MKNQKSKIKNQNWIESGQILVIILLVMIVGLTIGLFLIGRTTTDIALTTRTTESSRAFNAAEAGVEEAIRNISLFASANPSAIPLPGASGIKYTVVPTNLGSTNGVYPTSADKLTPISVGDTFTVWLVPHNETTGDLNLAGTAYSAPTMDLCFIRGMPRSAFGVTLTYLDGAILKSSYAVFDDGTSIPGAVRSQRTANNSFCPTFTNYFRIKFTNPNINFGNINITKLVALRIKVMLAPTKVAVDPVGNGPGSNLPKQGNNIKSTGTSGEITRKIEVDETFSEPAPFMDHVLFSREANLSK